MLINADKSTGLAAVMENANENTSRFAACLLKSQKILRTMKHLLLRTGIAALRLLPKVLVWLLLAVPAFAVEKSNILMLVVDDLRPQLGCYGHRNVQTPNIDRFAAQGMVFDHAYCQQAVCSPSRASLLTGTRPDTTKVWDLKTHFRRALPEVVTLPQFFKNNGYFVQAMGKVFHGNSDDPRSWSVPWSRPELENWGTPGTYGDPSNQELARRNATKTKGNSGGGEEGGSRGPAFEGADVPDNTYHDGRLAEMAIAALRQMKDRGQPFWLGVGFIRPHLPFVSPKKYWDLYDPAAIDLAPNPFAPHGAPAYAVPEGGELRGYADIPGGHIPDAIARKLKHGYFAAISYVDAQIGLVIRELEQLGLRENTIVVLMADHGWKLGEHDAWAKHTNVELDTHVPLIISVPGMKNAGLHSGALVELVDVYPSLAELSGLPLPENLEGASFVPLLAQPQRTWKSAVFSQYPRANSRTQLMGYSMRTDRYRLTRWVERGNPTNVDAVELYYHQADPQENENVAGQPANAALLRELTAQALRGWRGAWPSNN